MTDEHFQTLDTCIHSDADHELALQYAPTIRFDIKEPFLPSVVGYTIFRQDAPSPSFPRDIQLIGNTTTIIEYAVWWDWDIGHLYEIEHIWVHINKDGNIVNAEASWHGGFNQMADENKQMPIEDGRLAVHSEPGKHAFAPSTQWLLERKPKTLSSCGVRAGKMGVHVTPLFEDVIHDRTPLNNRLVHTYLERLKFEPTYDFSNVFDLKDAVFVVWQNLFAWIPERVHWWTQELQQMIPPHERRVLRIAHRGASAYAQENSAESLHKAAELGADMVEIDIRVSADNMPVVAHDSSLKRIYGIDGIVSDFSLDELQKLEGGSQIMTFEKAVTLCRSLHLGIYLDIKEINREVGLLMLQILEEQQYIKQVIFGSFRPDYLVDIKTARPDVLTSILFSAVTIDAVKLAQSINADYVHPCWERRAEKPHQLLTPEWINAVREAELGIVCWHEERPSEIAALQALGVDAICSDKPELLLKK